jgi:hypothetical protein
MATNGEKHVRQWGEPTAATAEKPLAVDTHHQNTDRLLSLRAPDEPQCSKVASRRAGRRGSYVRNVSVGGPGNTSAGRSATR